MKLFIASLFTLSLIFGLCTWGTVYGTKTIDAMICELTKVKSLEYVPENTEEIYKKLASAWEKKSFKLSLLLPHHHLDEVKEKLVQLGAYSDTSEFAEWHDAVLGLNEELEHIRGLVRINIDNIM